MLKRDKGTNLFATNNTLRSFFQLFVQLSGGNAAEHQPTTPPPGARPRPSPPHWRETEAEDAPEQRVPERYEGIGGKIPPRIAKYELFSYLCAPKRSSGRGRAHSSVGQSSGLIIRRSWDHAPLGPPENPAANEFAAGFLFSTGGRFSPVFFVSLPANKKKRLWNSKVPCTK